MSSLTPHLSAENTTGHVAIDRVPWSTYLALLNAIGDSAVRLTYDRGRLEIEMPSLRHERLKGFVARLIEAYALQARIDVLPAGSTTWRLEQAEGGLEADECYYVQHYKDVVEKEELDLTIDPPPDLAVEIEVSRSSAHKRDVYARLGVPELWRLHDERLECLHRDAGGDYRPASASLALPALPLDLVSQAIGRRPAVGDAEAVRWFIGQLSPTPP